MMRQSAIGTNTPSLLVMTAVLLDAVIILLAAFVAEPQSAIYFGMLLLVGDMLGSEFYLRSRRRPKPSEEGGVRIAGWSHRSSPLASVRHLLSREDAEARSIRREFVWSSRWAALSRLNYPMLVVAVALSSPILAALLFALKPVFNFVAFQHILDRRTPSATDERTTKTGRGSPPWRTSLSRWALVLLSIAGAALVIIATGFAGSDFEVAQPWRVVHHLADFSPSHIAGAVLGISAAAITALILQANKWADRAHAYAESGRDSKRTPIPKKPWLAIYVELRALRIAVLPLAALAVVLDIAGLASVPSLPAILLALAAGILIRTSTQICLRTAYARSDDATLPAIESSLPLVSFLVLGVFGKASVQQPDSLVLGVIVTTLSLALLHFKSAATSHHRIHSALR